MVEPIESPKKFNMKKVTILDDEEANKSRKSRLKQQRKEDRDEHNDDSEDSGTDFSIYRTDFWCFTRGKLLSDNLSGSQTLAINWDDVSYRHSLLHFNSNRFLRSIYISIGAKSG